MKSFELDAERVGSWCAPAVVMLGVVLCACNGELSGGLGGAHPGGGSGGAGAGPNGGGGAFGSGGAATVPPPFEPPLAMLKRLTRAQFRNSVFEIFGADVDVSELEPDSFNGNFATIGASTVVTSELGVERYHAAIEDVVTQVFADEARRTEFMGCAPITAGDECTRAFLTAKGRRAWRRPLEGSEVDRLVGVATTVASELDSPIEGARWATVALFISPSFLYRPELGEATASGEVRLSGHELASRLSFLIWNSLPDEQLLDEAASGLLDTTGGVREVAERMLATDRGREAVGAFAEEYMRLDRVLTQAKDASLYPTYGQALQAGMVADMRGTWEVLAFDEDASALDLFKTTTVVANLDVARAYGLDESGLDASTFEVRSLPAGGPRVGILSKLGFLSQFANQKEGSPTLRGKFIREALLCTPVKSPPGAVALELPEPADDAPMTKRQRLEVHRTDVTCAGCHGYMDPLGLPLELFDAIGSYRTTDLGLPIDPSGELDGVSVADARELGFALGASPAVAECLARKYYAYAVGHEERDVDQVIVQELNASFAASGYRLRELILDVVTSDAFAAVRPQL